MSQKLVLVVDNPSGSYYTPFSHIGPLESDPRVLNTEPQKVGLVVFTGGEDVDPSIYNEKRNYKTCSCIGRDAREKKVFLRAVELGLPIAGICRGSQFICAMSGGKLIQHITNHGTSHRMQTDDGRIITVSSTHHQMQLPPKEAVVVGWAMPRLSTCYQGPPGIEYSPEYEYECVYYPKTNAVGMQYHPEYMNSMSEGFRYCGELMKRFFGL